VGNSFQLLALRVGDGHAGLFLAGEALERALELGHGAVGVRILGDGLLRVLVALDGGVLGDELTELVGLGEDLGGINGHACSFR
jgi:hypothetical protein